jgi:hypothetical protein
MSGGVPLSRTVRMMCISVAGQLLASFMCNSGGAWDNAKKTIEDEPRYPVENLGKGSERPIQTGEQDLPITPQTKGPAGISSRAFGLRKHTSLLHARHDLTGGHGFVERFIARSQLDFARVFGVASRNDLQRNTK